MRGVRDSLIPGGLSFLKILLQYFIAKQAVSLEISAETPTAVPGAENSPLSSGQQTAAIPGFLSIESVRPQEVEVGDSFAFEVEPTTFVHENSGEPLQYVATKADGGPLPSWVDFDAESLTFSGQAPTNAQEKLDVVVKAIDSASQQAQVQMRIDVRKQ